MILLVSNKCDISMDLVVRALEKRNSDFFRLNTEDFPYMKCSTSSPDFWYSLEDLVGTRHELGSNLESVLYRRPGTPLSKSGIEPEAELRYCKEQWYAFLEGLRSIDGVLWINDISSNDFMESKIVQLRIAARLGFSIPRTCITSDSEEARSFFDGCDGRIVAKALHAPLIQYPDEDFFIFTTAVEDLENVSNDEFSIAPTIFQECLSEKVNYRVTVVGEDVFPVRIQSAQTIPIDWRTQENGLEFIPCAIPSDLQDKCLEFMSKCNLVFGAFDFAKVGDEFFFLEINPSGEWGWLQQRASLPIAEAIANQLLLGKIA